MCCYIKDMIDSLSMKINGMERIPAADDLLAKSAGKKLNKEMAKEFHTTVAKGLFVCKQAFLDIQPTVAVLCSRVMEEKESDWDKMIHMLKYLN